MTPRRQIRKDLSLARYYLRVLPLYIDCSSVQGDTVYTSAEVDRVKRDIEKLERELTLADG